MEKILVIGFGNPGRLDDGLGPRFVDKLTRIIGESYDENRFTLESNYQLNVEDAASIAEHDMVIFVDASVAGNEPFYFETVQASRTFSFSSHSVTPGVLLSLAKSCFNCNVKACMLGIRGYEFNEFEERLSPGAENNLGRALDFFVTRFSINPARQFNAEAVNK